MLTKKTLLVAALVAALGAGIVGVGTTLAAQTGEGRQPKFMTEVVSAIADKFDLDADEVQAVVDAQIAIRKDNMRERREDRLAVRMQKFEERLAQAVTDGELTQDQADEILEKRDELKETRESLKDETPEDRKAAMGEQIEALNDWAEENDIPEQYVRFGPPPMHRGGPMGGRGVEGDMTE